MLGADVSRIDEIVDILNNALDAKTVGKDYSFIEIVIALTSFAGMLHSDVVTSGIDMLKKSEAVEDVDGTVGAQQEAALESLVERENLTPLGVYAVPSAAFNYLVTSLLATYVDLQSMREEAN